MRLYVRVTMKIERASQSSKTWFSVIVVARLSRDKMGPKKQIDFIVACFNWRSVFENQ